MSATSLDYTCVMNHQATKALCNNRVFSSQQRDALQVTDERLNVAHLGIKDVADVFTNDMEVQFLSSKLYAVVYAVALKVHAGPQPGYT